MTPDDFATSGPVRARLTRRAVVRTGSQAAWAVPVVTVASAAPAYATSESPTIEALSAAYDPTAMDSLIVNATVRGARSLSLGIPGGQFDSVIAPGATVVRGERDGWTLTYADPPRDFTTAIVLGSTTEAPWRGHWAPAFTLLGMARSAGGSTVSTDTAVAAGDGGAVLLSRDVETETGAPGEEWGVTGEYIAVDESYRGVTGPIAVTVKVARRGDTPPVLERFGPTATWQTATPATDHTDEDWVFCFRTVREWHTSRTGVPADRGPVRPASGASFVAGFRGGGFGGASLTYSTTNAAGTVTDSFTRGAV